MPAVPEQNEGAGAALLAEGGSPGLQRSGKRGSGPEVRRIGSALSPGRLWERLMNYEAHNHSLGVTEWFCAGPVKYLFSQINLTRALTGCLGSVSS